MLKADKKHRAAASFKSSRLFIMQTYHLLFDPIIYYAAKLFIMQPNSLLCSQIIYHAAK